MIVRPKLTIVADDLIERGKAAWTDRGGSVLAVTDLYDVDDPTDEMESVSVPPGMENFIYGLIVNPYDFDATKDLVARR